MDKQTLSNYGWLVIVTLILAVMLAFATPFGTYVGDGVVSVANGIVGTSNDATAEENISQESVEWAVKTDYGIDYNTFKYYNTLEDAVEAVNNNSYITASSKLKNNNVVVGISKDGNAPVVRLLSPIIVTDTISVEKSVTIDLNGYEFSTKNITQCFKLANNIHFDICSNVKTKVLFNNVQALIDADNITKYNISIKNIDFYSTNDINSSTDGLARVVYAFNNNGNKDENSLFVKDCTFNSNVIYATAFCKIKNATCEFNNLHININTNYVCYGLQLSSCDAKIQNCNFGINVDLKFDKVEYSIAGAFLTNSNININDCNFDANFINYKNVDNNVKGIAMLVARDNTILNANNIKINCQGSGDVAFVAAQQFNSDDFNGEISEITLNNIDMKINETSNITPPSATAYSNSLLQCRSPGKHKIFNSKLEIKNDAEIMNSLVCTTGEGSEIIMDNVQFHSESVRKHDVLIAISDMKDRTATNNIIKMSNIQSNSKYLYHFPNNKTNVIYKGINCDIKYTDGIYYNYPENANIIETNEKYR